MNYPIKLFVTALLLSFAGIASAQSPVKEAANGFALYNKSKKMDDLVKARKSIDDAYKTRRDSAQDRNNLIRSLIYAALANADSDRKLTYVKDPIKEAMFSMSKLNNKKFNDQHTAEITYYNKQLCNAYLIRANKGMNEQDYASAFNDYIWVDSLSSGNVKVKHDLAILSQRLGYNDRAVYYYKKLLNDQKQSKPEYYLALADIFQSQGEENKTLETLRQGYTAYPKNKDILFREINIYNNNRDYPPITALIDDAINMEPENLDLYYLAGFSFENSGKKALAETYYRKMIDLDDNNYAANYALGLLYLDKFYKNNTNRESLTDAGKYLKKANDINPNSVNTLKSLAMYYSLAGDESELQQINDKLNQVILN